MPTLQATEAAPEAAVRLASMRLLDAHCRQRYGDRGRLERLLANRDPVSLLQTGAPSIAEVRLARALAFMDSGGPPGVAAMRILSRVMDDRRAEPLSPRDADLLYQLRLIHERWGLAVAQLPSFLTPQVSLEITADLLHPQQLETPRHLDWERAFSRAVGIECVVPEGAWSAGYHGPFDGIDFPRARTATQEGPLVSVITSCYRPDRGLISAIRSLCRQTWGDLELIVVDDGSGPEFDDILFEVAELDPRIRLLRNSENRGTYARRNQALDLARGRYITFQDADDLSAPDRIQRHVQTMEDESRLLGTLSMCAKVEPSLRVTRPGYRSRSPNAVSLMLRSAAVLPGIGYFHEVRRGGDGEYIRRLRARFGAQALGTIHSEPLMLVRRTPGSLSSGDFSPGRKSPRRWAYQMVTSYRHRAVQRPSDHFLSRRSARSTDIGIVPSTVARASSTPQTFDIAYLADFSERNPESAALRGDVGRALARGLRVALSQCDRPEQLPPGDVRLADWVLGGLLDGPLWLLVDDSEALVTHLVVESAEAITLGLLPRACWRAQSVELRLTSTPDTASERTAVRSCATRILEGLGVLPTNMKTTPMPDQQTTSAPTTSVPFATVAVGVQSTCVESPMQRA